MANRLCALVTYATCGFLCLAASSAHAEDSPAQRSVLFTYSCEIAGLKPHAIVDLWLPMPPETDSQKVQITKEEEDHVSVKPAWGQQVGPNRFFHDQFTANDDGKVAVSFTYRITRTEVGQTPVEKGDDLNAYLAPDRLIPVGGKPAQVLLAGKTVPADPLAAGRFFYNLVDDSMQYRKDKPGWGRGDADWACESHFGNCTDFHSLFISLARTRHLPAKFEIGFAIPEKSGSGPVAGYHCWAEFAAAGKWVPVDISQANLDPSKRDYSFGHLDDNRVLFTTGRDLKLAPAQSGPPLNFFIYPYAEVAGKPWPADRITHTFSYEDVK